MGLALDLKAMTGEGATDSVSVLCNYMRYHLLSGDYKNEHADPRWFASNLVKEIFQLANEYAAYLSTRMTRHDI